MTQLMQQAGLPRPEFEDTPGALLVRFRPSSSLPPRRVGRNLSKRQQDVLRILADGGEVALKEIVVALGPEVERRGVQADLQLLRSLELVENGGFGRGARWWLRDGNEHP